MHRIIERTTIQFCPVFFSATIGSAEHQLRGCGELGDRLCLGGGAPICDGGERNHFAYARIARGKDRRRTTEA